MAFPVLTSAAPNQRRGNSSPMDPVGSDSLKARIFFLVACLWPLLFFLLIATGTPSGSSSGRSDDNSNSSAAPQSPVLQLRKYLDRVDIMGYGPTHPRVSVVVVGDDADSILRSVESVFRNMDHDRLFLVCTVVEGAESDADLSKKLHAIDQGSVPHWHGQALDKHEPGEKSQEHEDPHAKKIHVLFNEKKQGIAKSRADAVEFISLVAMQHEKAGKKSPEEDLILVLLKSGATLVSKKWLSRITSALIVPPPLMRTDDEAVALKMANAISFALDGAISERASSFDYAFRSVQESLSASAMALSNGESYPAPVLSGEATALRLDTYLGLPSQDTALADEFAANLDLSLNLWLCADGIDVLNDVTVSAETPQEPPQLTPEQAARFAAAWMDEGSASKVFNAVSQSRTDLTRLQWDTLIAEAKGFPTFPLDLTKKCRRFSWYAEEINMSLEGRAKEETPARVLVKAPGEPEVAPGGGEKLPPSPFDDQKHAVTLDSARLDIVTRAQPINLEYVDVAGDHKEHPHMGARDENGNWGYVHDETALRLNPPAFQFDNLKEACNKRDDNRRMLTEQVYVDMEGHTNAEKSGRKRDKIFCLVYTIEQNHGTIPPIRETWGQKCDGFMVGSNLTDPSIGAVDIAHEGKEEYNNIWQKVRSLWCYVYDNYYEKYDWFHIGGDDLFLLVENLRLYLESDEIQLAQNGGFKLPDGGETEQTPLFLGRRFAYWSDMDDIFNSGGSGYTLNRAALKTLVVKGIPRYFPHAHTPGEDTVVARMFKNFGVLPYDTKDEDGGERYMPFMPGHHWGFRPPPKCKKDSKSKDCKEWYVRYSIDIKYGKEHCAKKSIAFHYVKGDSMKRLHALLYKLCPQ